MKRKLKLVRLFRLKRLFKISKNEFVCTVSSIGWVSGHNVTAFEICGHFVTHSKPELGLFDNRRIQIFRGGQIVTVGKTLSPPTTGKYIGQIALPSLPSRLRAVYSIHSDFEISRIVKLFTKNMKNQVNSSRFQTLQNL